MSDHIRGKMEFGYSLFVWYPMIIYNIQERGIPATIKCHIYLAKIKNHFEEYFHHGTATLSF